MIRIGRMLSFLSVLLFSSLCQGIVEASSGTVVVSDGNTLHVHSSPTTSAPTLYDLNNGATVAIECYTQGDMVTGSQGTTDQWDEIDSSTYGVGYASHAYIVTSDTIPSCASDNDKCNGIVVVSTGETLKVHSLPSTTSSTLYNLDNNATVALTCVTMGDTVTGSQGTTSDWYEIDSGGYASAAYMKPSCVPDDCTSDPTDSTFQQALDYGLSMLGTIYVGCAGGEYRFGEVAPYDMYHDGTTCGQSRVYFQPEGSVGFDCSGLMVEMFAAAGIYLPYQSSTAIVENVPEVPKSSIQNGDMLAKSGHVVMWIGNNQVIESTPYYQNSDTSWTGTRINSDSDFMNNADYTAHRYPGLY